MLSLLLLAAVAVDDPTGKLDLTPRFKEGETFFLLEKNRITQQFQAEDVVTKNVWTERRVSRFQVLQASKDQLVLEQTLLRLEGNVDSGKPQVPKGLAGAVLKWTIDLKERKLRGEGHDELVARLAKESGIQADLVRQALPAETLEGGVFSLVGLTPRQPVGKGDSWTTRLATSLGAYGGLNLETRFSIQAVGAEKVLEATGNVKPEFVPPSPGKERAFQIQSARLSKEKGQCKLLFNLSQGRVEKSELSLAFTLALQLTASNRSLAVTITQERSTSMEVLAKEPAEETAPKQEGK